MLSIEQIRNDPDTVRAALVRRAEDEDCLDDILTMDARRRVAVTEGDELRARRNQVSREIGQARSQGQPAALRRGRPDARSRPTHQRSLRTRCAGWTLQINDAMMALPNLPHASTPDGHDEAANVVLRHWGEPTQLDFEAQPHWDIAERLGIIDFQRGVKLSGSRFYTLNGYGARLERAIISWMLDLHGQRARLHRNGAAHPGASGDHGRLGQPAAVRRQPVSRRGG